MSTTGRSGSEIAKDLGLREMDTESAIDMIKIDILRTFYDPDTKDEYFLARNEKVKKAYLEWTGFEYEHDGEKILSTMLLGSPGQGKTTAFKEASKMVASALDLIYLENPDDKVKVTREHFMFVSQEFSAENSKVDLGGIPAKVVDEDGDAYMTKLVNKRLATARKSGGSLLLLDDFPNASANIQNIGLSVTDEKRFQGLNLDGVYIGLTGNLGAIDGTHTAQLSTALRGRVKTFFTQDKLENFITRTQKRFKDNLGDMGICGFLQRSPESFASMPDKKKSGGFTSPRTWDHFIIQARRAVKDSGGTATPLTFEKIRREASSLLGGLTGLKVYSYTMVLMLGADPLAKNVIFDDYFDKETFKKKYGEGFSSSNADFAYQMGFALGDYAVAAIVQELKKYPTKGEEIFKKYMERYAKGLMPIENIAFTLSLDYLKNKLANVVDEYTIMGQNNQKALDTKYKKIIMIVFQNHPDMTFERGEAMASCLSDADKYEALNPMRARRQNGN